MAEQRIQLLSDHVCNKIAAGEVIERPASVFKELIENAIDAGASSVEVEVLQGGRKAVIVSDNGCGMNRDDALLCLERHATSKIRDVDDIEYIRTMGFRGEALAAIAAVSRFTLTTRPKEDLSGTEIIVSGGTVHEVNDAGCPPGTTIAVRNLFFNVPARKKFLRTEATELANIRQMFQVFCLAHPGIAMRLSVDGREWMRLPPHTAFQDRLTAIYGDEIAPHLRPVLYEDGELKIHGFTGLPSYTRKDRKDQIILINQRPASAPLIGYAIKQAYQNALPRDRHPVLFLFLDMPPDWVDVNVHPTKREVRFRAGQRIRDAVIRALTEAIQQARETNDDISSPAFTSQLPPRAAAPTPLKPAMAIQQPELTPRPSYPPTPLPERSAEPLPPECVVDLPENEPPPEDPHPWKRIRILGQLDHRFVVMETEDGMVLMDPQAAQERVLYEQALREIDAGAVATQNLLAPETVECTPQHAERIRSQLATLTALGFEISAFGGDSFMVEGLPAWLGDIGAEEVLLDFASTLETSGPAGVQGERMKETAARSCCRLAAQRKRAWQPRELEQLVHQLGKCDMPYTTPFGRSTIIFTGFNELKRKFGIR